MIVLTNYQKKVINVFKETDVSGVKKVHSLSRKRS